MLAAAVASVGSAATGTKRAKLPIRPGTYSGTVTMAPIYEAPGSSVRIMLSGTWKLKVDRHDHVTGTESLTGVMPIKPSGGCTASPDAYTLTFQARFGRKKAGLGITGAPGLVRGKVLVVDLDSETGTGARTDQGWSATPSRYQLTCGNISGSHDVLFFGELGEPIADYTVRLPLGLFSKVGHRYSARVEVMSHKLTQTFKLTRR